MDIDTLSGFNTDAHGKVFDPPIDMGASNGFSFTCGYTNPTTAEIGWGLGSQEMCEMLGFADSALVYDAYVDDGANMVGPTQNGIVTNSGPCTVISLPWNQDKMGGVPPK